MKSGHVPIRMCIGCRKRRPKHEMIRLTGNGVDVDGHQCEGRGFYLCPDQSCIDKGLTGPLMKKHPGMSGLYEVLKSLASTEGTEKRLDGSRLGRVIYPQYHGGGSLG